MKTLRDIVRQADVDAGGPQCRVCGCTANSGCIPPCRWTEADLCSACDMSLNIRDQLSRVLWQPGQSAIGGDVDVVLELLHLNGSEITADVQLALDAVNP